MLRYLIIDACLWGEAAALPVAELFALGRAGRYTTLRALAWLRREGLVSVDRARGLVRLTPKALWQVTDLVPSDAMALPATRSLSVH
jgi:DNA-binding IclR family transcriptional regulator